MYTKLYAAVLTIATALAGQAHARYTTECPYTVTGVAYHDVLKIRAWPSPQSRVIGVLAPGESGVIVTRFKGNWGRLYGAANGWVNMRYLRANCH